MNTDILNEFLSTLNNEMVDLGVDYEVSSPLERFALWVGHVIFELQLDELDDWLLFSDERLGAILGFFNNNGDKANIITCWYESDSQVTQINEDRFQRLIQLWDNEKVKANDKEFFLQLEENDFIDMQHIVLTNGIFLPGIHETLELFALTRLRDNYTRAKNPQKVEEPPFLEFEITGKYGFLGPNVSTADSGEESIATLVCALPMQLIY
ncbi:MAG: hypothetical protein GY943_20685, partial [Chloroflexi bacterium]|nr:hypothetical protein [Chloroflexota bacterium]